MLQMKNENRQKSKKVRLNFIDFILIAVMLLALGMLIFIFSTGDISISAKNKATVEYTVEIDRVPEEFKNLVKVGNTVYDTETLCNLGEVIDISYSSSYYKGADNATGDIVYSEYPDEVRMTITIKASASKTDTGYSVSDYSLSVGKSMRIRVPDFTGIGICSSIDAAENAN